jgi:hypothetical protein
VTEVELGATALSILIGAGAFSAVLSVWVFRRWSDSVRLRAASNRILAHLLEIQLYASEPSLILKAQRELIAENVRLLRAVIRPMLMLALPFAALFIALEAFFGRAPLRPGEAAVVTVQFKNEARNSMPELQITSTTDMPVDAPAVRIPREGQISWRVRPIRDSNGELSIRCGDRIVTKSISAELGLNWLSERRRGWAATLLHPFELPLSDPAIDSIEVHYPSAAVFHMHWFIWFLAGALAGSSISLLTELGKK